MQTVRQKILSEWSGTPVYEESDLFVLDEKHFDELYKLYDKHAFDGQIQKRVVNLLAKGKVVVVEFANVPDSSANRWCGVMYHIEQNFVNYTIQISPWVIARIECADADDLADIFGTQDIEEALLIWFEHQLSHLLALLWDQVGPVSNPLDETYGVHGKLFKCTTDAFFGDTVSDVVVELSNSAHIPSLPHPDEHGRYSYWSNSCNLDSLTTILMFSESSVFRDAIFGTNAALVNYRVEETPGVEVFHQPCENSYLQDEEAWRDYVARVQSQFFCDYTNMITEGHTMRCYNIRKLFRECYPDMKKHGTWRFYNIAELYQLVVRMFPTLLYRNVPYMRIEPGKESIRGQHLETKEMFSFWEYMDPLDDVELAAEDILWDELEDDVLVFRNGGLPPIVNFGDIDPEEVEVQVYKRIPKKKTKTIVRLPEGWKLYKSSKTGKYYYYHKKTEVSQWEPPSDAVVEELEKTIGQTAHLTLESVIINKKRAFDETIINGKYEMFAAAVLQGTKPGKEGGIHYIAYIKTTEGWYHYNDSGDIWKIAADDGAFPRDEILYERDGKKPELYFYRRV